MHFCSTGGCGYGSGWEEIREKKGFLLDNLPLQFCSVIAQARMQSSDSCSCPITQEEPQGKQKDHVTVEEGPRPGPTLPRAIVLDLTPVNFLDTVGVKTLRNVREATRPRVAGLAWLVR